MKKEELKKKLQKGFNKFKKWMGKVGVAIKKFVKKLYDKFMELPKKIRLIIYVWVIVVFVLLVFIGATNGSKKFYSEYQDMENKLTAQALKYVKNKNIYATKDNKLVIDLETLKETNYVDASIVSDDTCEGISVVYYDDNKDDYVVSSYLNCKRYTTKNYWDYK